MEDSYSEFETQEPIVIRNYYFKQVKGKRSFTRMGKDGVYRSSIYSCAVFIFTNHQMIYQKTLLSVVHPLVKTFSEEYYYDDIVTVKTHESASSNLDMKSCYEDSPQFVYNSFELVTKGGNKVSFSFSRTIRLKRLLIT